MKKGKEMKSFGKIAIVGDSYSTYVGYNPVGNAICYNGSYNGIDSVDKTWWKLLEKETNSKIVINESYSGSTLSRKFWGVINAEQSFPERVKKIDFNNIDTLFILGGTNDCWSNATIGSIKFNEFCDEDFYLSLPSFCALINYVKQKNPSVKIINIVNTGLKQELVDGYKLACDFYGVDNIELKDITKNDGHPDVEGMEQIKNQIIGYYK